MTPLFLGMLAASTIATSSQVCIGLTRDMRYKTGDAAAGGGVSALQNFLGARGYFNAKTTGYFGDVTLRAVKAFQKDHGLHAAGFAGPQTRAKIAALTCANGEGSRQASGFELPPDPAAPIGGSSAATSTAYLATTTKSGISGGAGGASGAVWINPDSPAKIEYLKMRADYDAAATLDAFAAVSARYASAARQKDVAVQRALLKELSPEDKAEMLFSMRSVIPGTSEIQGVAMLEEGAMATGVVTPVAGSGKQVKGLITLVFEGGAWRLQSEKWIDSNGLGTEPLPSASGG